MSWLTKKYYYVTVWEWMVLILALIILFLYICSQTRAPNLERYVSKNRDNLTWITVNDVLRDANNGDVVLLSGDTHGERTCRWCTNSIFSHVGVLFWEMHPVTMENILYVFDCDLGQKTKEGVRVMPLRDKLHRYKGMRIGALKKMIVHSPATRPTRDDFVNLLPKYTPIVFDNVIATWWVADWMWLYKMVKNPKTMFCGELVASVFQDLNILKKDRVPAWYIPGDFHRNRLWLEEGYSFGETMFFEFPIDQTKHIVESSLPVETGMDEFIGGDYSILPGMADWLEDVRQSELNTSKFSGDSKADNSGHTANE